MTDDILLTKLRSRSTFISRDGPCEVSREALTLEPSWERTRGFLHFQPVFQTNMLMLWAVSFQIPIKAALDVGDCRGRSIR